jgi:hypothetical protein
MAMRSFHEWQTIIEQQEASELFVTEFCQLQQINQNTFMLGEIPYASKSQISLQHHL